MRIKYKPLKTCTTEKIEYKLKLLFSFSFITFLISLQNRLHLTILIQLYPLLKFFIQTSIIFTVRVLSHFL